MAELITDPQRIAELASQFEQTEIVKQIKTILPNSTEVTLPGGFVGDNNEIIKTAEIRELNGADEEALSASNSPSKALSTVLSRAVVSLGSDKPTSKDFDELLSGDRDALLLGIRIATFGKDIEFTGICQSCFTEQDIKIDLEKDVPIKELDNPLKNRVFSVTVKAGDVVLSLPNGVTARRLMDVENSSIPEIVTTILSGCIISINGEPSLGAATARGLGISDREKLVAELYERTPGPRLGEVTKACEACDAEISVPLSLAELFRL
jgi:hypothetical protein